MDVRAAISGLGITGWAGAGATENARASLDEWNRAQEAVAALLARLDHHPARRLGGAPPAAGRHAVTPRPVGRQAVGPT